MSIHCPKCNQRINPLKIKPFFPCPQCKTELVGKIIIPSLIAFVIASAIDWWMVDSIYAYAGSDWWPGFALRMAINTVIYMVINTLLLILMGKVEIAHSPVE